MRTRRLCVALLLAVMLAIPSVAAAYVGSLLSTTGGIQGTGNWITDPAGMSFEWVVTQNADDSWHYSYVFTHPVGETSHFILEVSDNFTANDIFNLQGDVGSVEIGEFGAGNPSNPGIPGSMYGIKFDETSGLVTTFAFDSFRVPVWQDFYSKDGVAGGIAGAARRGGVMNAAWNTGFLTDDPTAPAADGSIDYHVLAPDSVTNPVPEPTTLMLLGSGLLGSVAVLRRRRK